VYYCTRTQKNDLKYSHCRGIISGCDSSNKVCIIWERQEKGEGSVRFNAEERAIYLELTEEKGDDTENIKDIHEIDKKNWIIKVCRRKLALERVRRRIGLFIFSNYADEGRIRRVCRRKWGMRYKSMRKKKSKKNEE
jgi:hypothetical protein